MSDARTVVTLGTATPGGGFPVYGQAVADTINEIDPSLEMKPQNTKGSTENVPMLEAGTLDLALVQGEVAHEAWAGIGRAPAALRLVAAMYSTAGMFVVRADSPYKTIRDLVGQPVAFGAKGSGLPILSRYMLDGIGLKQDEDFKSIYLDRAGDGPAMVLDGRTRGKPAATQIPGAILELPRGGLTTAPTHPSSERHARPSPPRLLPLFNRSNLLHAPLVPTTATLLPGARSRSRPWRTSSLDAPQRAVTPRSRRNGAPEGTGVASAGSVIGSGASTTSARRVSQHQACTSLTLAGPKAAR